MSGVIDDVLAAAVADPRRVTAELIRAKKNLNAARSYDARTYWRRRYNALEQLEARLRQEGVL